MNRTMMLNGHPVKVRVTHNDIEAVLDLCAHDPDAVQAFADAQAQHLPERLHRFAGNAQLAYSYARQALAAEMAAAQLHDLAGAA